MDKLEIKICSDKYGDMEITLTQKTENDYFDIPIGKEVVYNDNMYSFCILGVKYFPTKFYINDEAYDIATVSNCTDGCFKLKGCNDRPFLHSFGAIKIEIEINGQIFISKSIKVLVANNNINNSVINMIHYIYDNCEKYLYEEHKHSLISTGIKENEIRSLEAKIAILEDVLSVYKKAYQYLKTNPYSKLQRKEKVDSFGKVQFISSNTVQYIINHIDELVSVNYNTGIVHNKKSYQPNKTLLEYNSYSFDVYENQVIIGFLQTIVSDISKIIKDIQERVYDQSQVTNKNGYIDSMYQIFSLSIKKISDYVEMLLKLKKEYQQIYYYYVKIFNISGNLLNSMPIFTSVFKSINAYRQIYEAIYNWFYSGNYDLGKEELLLSFISTSKIYEYYCLVKMLYYLDNKSAMIYSETPYRFIYPVKNNYYTNTKYNNTFVFEKDDKKLTLYFQPVIYGDDLATNGISLFRNTSSNSEIGNYNKGTTYTPDYIIKIKQRNKKETEYIILDAKFTTPDNIKNYQLQELIYKYLFSISPLDNNDSISALYFFCGKTNGKDEPNIIHDLAHKINREIHPFAEVLIMNGNEVDDYSIPSLIFKDL